MVKCELVDWKSEFVEYYNNLVLIWLFAWLTIPFPTVETQASSNLLLCGNMALWFITEATANATAFLHYMRFSFSPAWRFSNKQTALSRSKSCAFELLSVGRQTVMSPHKHSVYMLICVLLIWGINVWEIWLQLQRKIIFNIKTAHDSISICNEWRGCLSFSQRRRNSSWELAQI